MNIPQDRDSLLLYHAIKRQHTAIDEWLTYIFSLFLLLMYFLYPFKDHKTKNAILLIFLTGFSFGVWCIITLYANLGLIEEQLGLCPKQYTLYPF